MICRKYIYTDSKSLMSMSIFVCTEKERERERGKEGRREGGERETGAQERISNHTCQKTLKSGKHTKRIYLKTTAVVTLDSCLLAMGTLVIIS